MLGQLFRLDAQVWILPFVSLFLNAIFGSLGFIDNVTIFFIQYWVSNLGMLAHFASMSLIFSEIFRVR